MNSATMTDTWTWLTSPGPQQWAMAAISFAVLLVALLWLQSALMKRLHRWGEASGAQWESDLADILRWPVRLTVILISFSIAIQFPPAWVGEHRSLNLGLKVAAVLVLTWMLERLVALAFRGGAFAKDLSITTRALLVTISKVIILLIGLLIALDSMGISVTPLLASLGVGSVAVALALQDTLGNFFAGLYLMIDKPLRLGDLVKLEDGTEGIVTRVGWRSTRIRMLANNLVVVPNSKLASTKLTNYDLPDPEYGYGVPMGVAYGSDLEKVERVTLEVARELQQKFDGAISSFQPMVLFNGLADSSVNFTVILRVSKYLNNGLMTHEFIKAIYARYAKEGIEIPFPQRTVHLINR